MRKLRLSIFVLVTLMVGLMPSLALAQVATTGKIAGVVTDSSGAAVPNATVTVKSTALMAERTTTAGADGAYLFDLLPPGTYEVTVTSRDSRVSAKQVWCSPRASRRPSTQNYKWERSPT